MPVHVVATNLLSGQEVCLSTGDAVSAVLASTAIPGLLPAVRRDGLFLVDGGLANNAAISQAVLLGADRIFVLPAGYACALTKPPASALAAALQALSFLTQQRLIHDVVDYADRADLHVMPPLCPLSISPADFRHARKLSERAHRTTTDWLDRGMDLVPGPEQFLSLHDHAPRNDPLVPGHAVCS
jgi:NTE family protein